MKDQFVTYEIAKKLKELGFNEPCFTCYSKKNQSDKECKLFDDEISIHNWNEYSGQTYSSPLWQQAIDWLKEKHSIKIIESPKFGWNIYLLYDNEYIIEGEYQTKETAILKALKLITK
jgi:hypothetical protein